MTKSAEYPEGFTTFVLRHHMAIRMDVGVSSGGLGQHYNMVHISVGLYNAYEPYYDLRLLCMFSSNNHELENIMNISI